MSKEKLIPTLRFSEFISKQDWRYTKLGVVADIVSGGTPSTQIEKYWNGDINWFSPTEIGNTPYLDSSERKITKLGLQKSSAKMLPIGTVLFTSRAGIGKTTVLAKEGTTNQGFQSIVPKKNILDSYFIYSRSQEIKHYAEVVGAGSTFIEVSGKQLEKMMLLVPDLVEQQKISSFFKKIDAMIQLQQFKVNKVKDIKSAYLSEMFPKKGEKYPKKRFEGFAKPWKEYNLGQIANIRTGYPFNSNEFSRDGKYLVITNGNIQDSLPIVDSSEGNRITMESTRIIDGYVLEAGDILVTMDGTVGRTAKVIEENQILAQRVGRLTAYENPEFLYQALQTGDFYKEMTLIGHGGTIKHISLSEIGSYQITMPDLKEQKKIAEFFQNLDHQIFIEEEKLAKLEKLKQAYLNDMFV